MPFEAKVSALPASRLLSPRTAENAAATNDRTPIVSFFIISASFVSFNSGLSDADTPKAEKRAAQGHYYIPCRLRRRLRRRHGKRAVSQGERGIPRGGYYAGEHGNEREHKIRSRLNGAHPLRDNSGRGRGEDGYRDGAAYDYIQRLGKISGGCSAFDKTDENNSACDSNHVLYRLFEAPARDIGEHGDNFFR